VQAGYRTGRYCAVATHNPERVWRFLQFLNAFPSSEDCCAVSSCENEPVPSSPNWGAWTRSFCNCSSVTLLLTFKVFNDLHLLTSFSSASKFTSLWRLAKFNTSNDVKLSEKQLNQLPFLSSMPFSCMSSSVKFLHSRRMKKTMYWSKERVSKKGDNKNNTYIQYSIWNP